jgi:hypothetical protein
MFFLAVSLFVIASAQISVQHLLTENRTNPVGVDAMIPRFSWQLSGDKRNLHQTAYALQVFSTDNAKLQSLNMPKPILHNLSLFLIQVQHWKAGKNIMAGRGLG